MFKNKLKALIDGSIDIDSINIDKESYRIFADKLIASKGEIDPEEVSSFLRICLAYYTYSTNGDELISDIMYDDCMNMYRSSGYKVITYPDMLGSKQWSLTRHKAPELVGEMLKVYNNEELESYLVDYNYGKGIYSLSLKYDGVSCVIEVLNGRLTSALTRHDGIEGQDITLLISRAGNIEWFMENIAIRDGFYKCELCMSREDFNILITKKDYKNQRSAVSGIVNTPSNIEFAEFITIIPLIGSVNGNAFLLSPDRIEVETTCSSDLEYEILNFMNDMYSRYRTDGVVVSPIFTVDIERESVLSSLVAYKKNTQEDTTSIIRAYFNVGRTGKAVPMLQVAPISINDTTVENASINSYNKFSNMNLREGEDVIIYAAGDVIPQAKPTKFRCVPEDAPKLQISKYCPYCDEKLERVGSDYYCVNDECFRIVTGKITNFLDKLGAKGLSDRTVENIYTSLGTNNIYDFLNLTFDMIKSVDGFEETSTNNLICEINKIRNKDIPISEFYGALAIPNIAAKTCRKIFEVISHDEILSHTTSGRLYNKLTEIYGVGGNTARVFLEYIEDNKELILKLLDIINISDDVFYMENAVFSGFRSNEIKVRLQEVGLDVSDSITSQTVVLIINSVTSKSTKVNMARNNNIPVIHLSEIDDFIEYRKNNL